MEILDKELFDQDIQHYFEASKGKRLTNYVIDYAANSLVSFVFWIFIGIILTLSLGEEVAVSILEADSVPSFLLQVVLSSLMSLAFFTIVEYYSKGKSLGKLITKTRAVQRSGERMTFDHVIKRSACRLIPFDAFSYLGELKSGWHDSIPGTKVIDENLPIVFANSETLDEEIRVNPAEEFRLK